MNDTVGVLTPTQKKTMQGIVQKCAACSDLLTYLEQLGHSDDELKQRADSLQMLAEKALEIDRETRKK